MIKPSEYLKNVKELIQDPNHWTKKGFFADPNNETCTLDNATRFCAMGAVYMVFRMEPKGDEFTKVLDALYNALPPGYEKSGIIGFNDTQVTTHEDIMDLMTHAIMYLEIDEANP